MRRFLLVLLLPLFLADCAKPIWAPDADVQKARYHSGTPPSITLITVIRKRGNEGAHSGLLINGSETVVFDPAGSWSNPAAPERNDVLFGMTPLMVKYYIDYHARSTYDVYVQTVPVSAGVADQAIARALGNGAVMDAMCGRNVSRILRDLPGFESIGQSYFPARIMRQFGALPGAVTTKHIDADSDNNKALLAAQTKPAAP